jgi:hypothetical protein
MSTIDNVTNTVTKRAITTNRSGEDDENEAFNVQFQQNPIKIVKYKHEDLPHIQYSASFSSPMMKITSTLATSIGSIDSSGLRIEGIFLLSLK